MFKQLYLDDYVMFYCIGNNKQGITYYMYNLRDTKTIELKNEDECTEQMMCAIQKEVRRELEREKQNEKI